MCIFWSHFFILSIWVFCANALFCPPSFPFFSFLSLLHNRPKRVFVLTCLPAERALREHSRELHLSETDHLPPGLPDQQWHLRRYTACYQHQSAEFDPQWVPSKTQQESVGVTACLQCEESTLFRQTITCAAYLRAGVKKPSDRAISHVTTQSRGNCRGYCSREILTQHSLTAYAQHQRLRPLVFVGAQLWDATVSVPVCLIISMHHKLGHCRGFTHKAAAVFRVKDLRDKL